VTRRLSIRDVRAVVERVPDLSGIVLVGGQALNFWAEALGIANEDSDGPYGPAVSGDIDFLGSPTAAMAFGEATGGKVKIAGMDDAHSPNTALVTLDIEGEEHLIDFLGGLKGFTFRELEKVKNSAMPVGLVPGRHQPILVMHPAHCLESQLENVYGYQLNRRAEPGGERYIGRIKLAIESCRRITQRYVDESDPRGALKVVEKVHTLSLLPAALRARVEDGVRIEDGILDAGSMPSRFLEDRLPRMRRIHELKLAKYHRIHGSK
jgi:hypothetical protein